ACYDKTAGAPSLATSPPAGTLSAHADPISNLPGMPALVMCIMTNAAADKVNPDDLNAVAANLNTKCSDEAKEWMKECYELTDLESLDKLVSYAVEVAAEPE